MYIKKVIYEGRFNGAGFRYAIKDIAKGYDVTGWVKKLLDGSVEMVASGEEEEVSEFLHEIIEESEITHHIKHSHEERLSELTPAPKGFIIQ